MVATKGKGRPTKLAVGFDKVAAAKALYQANALKGGERLLLIFLFASDEELRLLMMHPECLMVDTTFKTNKQKKELFTVAFKDGNNQGCNGARAYIPSGARWVFACLFEQCLPLFWGADVCLRVRLFLTDGDPHEYSQIIIAICVSRFCLRWISGALLCLTFGLSFNRKRSSRLQSMACVISTCTSKAGTSMSESLSPTML
jgi:hypothetical protein